MNKNIIAISGAGLGAGIMYLLDPDRGKRRRALVRDKAVYAVRKTRDAADATAKDASNRGRGIVSSIKSWFTDQPVDDRVLTERIRSKLGMVVRHPGSIEVQVDNGRVVLSGPVLEDEVDYLISMVSRVGGVKHVENRLEIHEDADNIPELQGSPDRPPRGERFEFMQVNWSPTARLLAGTAGGALALYGLRRSQTVGIGMATVGVALLARSLTNRELSRLFGVPATRRADRFSYGREWNGAGNGSAGPARSATTQKPVKDVMTPEVEVIRPDSSLQEAAEKMKTFNIGAIPVCDGDRLVGMLTDRDIAVRVVAEKRDAAETSVRDAMTSEVVYCYEDEDVGTASRIMADRQVRRLVVLNREKRLVGIVSLGDLAVQTSDRALGGKTLERISQPAEPQR